MEPWVRTRALDCHLTATPAVDFRLLVFHDDAGEVVAVSAHERNAWVVDPNQDPIPGTDLKLVAIADRFRDSRASDGRPLIAAILEATFDDIRARRRGGWAVMMVQSGNDDGRGVVDRLGATQVGAVEGDDVFVLALE